MDIALPVRPLTREAFGPFGDVIETEGARHFSINGGTTERYDDLALVDVDAEGGRPLISIFRGDAATLPIPVAMVERHPLGTQAFMPLSHNPYLVVVAEGQGEVPGGLHAFLASGSQGVSYHRGVWHHPLLALQVTSDFLVIDRGGEGNNLVEHRFDPPHQVIAALPVL